MDEKALCKKQIPAQMVVVIIAIIMMMVMMIAVLPSPDSRTPRGQK